jgi:hypothetical protein
MSLKIPQTYNKGETRMKNKKTIGIVLVAVGELALIGFLAVDTLGIGKAPGIGLFQVIGAVVGVIIAVVGLVLYSRK